MILDNEILRVEWQSIKNMNLDKIIDAINIPKRIVDGAELFLRKLLGPAITESGELIADQIRYRRFKNQVTIFSKAKNLLESKSIEPRQINLKTLVMGASQGVITIVRGAVPLALFGTQGYGAVLGLIATPIVVVNATVVFGPPERQIVYGVALFVLVAFVWHRGRGRFTRCRGESVPQPTDRHACGSRRSSSFPSNPADPSP